ncbi:MAG TPA: type I-B CRISPR-associated protein Cas5 [Aquifex aeolicus]|nr:type I-B CRISPR-associated protein Cas5 [Aquifex aeolicus]
MKVLVFDLTGEFAHFRAIYTNSSSISYGFPPRTTLMGIVAAILGYERDSYYDILSPEKALFSVSVLSPVRKFMQTINYVKTKEGFGSFKNAVNTYLKRKLETYPNPIELIFSPDSVLRYRIYFHSKEEVYDKLKDRLENGKSFFSIYLGITEFLADVEYVEELEVKPPMKDKGIRSVIPEAYFDRIDFSKNLSLIIENMPFHFEMEGNYRKVKKVKRFIYERDAREIPLRNYEGVISVNGENIIWME